MPQELVQSSSLFLTSVPSKSSVRVDSHTEGAGRPSLVTGNFCKRCPAMRVETASITRRGLLLEMKNKACVARRPHREANFDAPVVCSLPRLRIG